MPWQTESLHQPPEGERVGLLQVNGVCLHACSGVQSHDVPPSVVLNAGECTAYPGYREGQAQQVRSPLQHEGANESGTCCRWIGRLTRDSSVCRSRYEERVVLVILMQMELAQQAADLCLVQCYVR